MNTSILFYYYIFVCFSGLPMILLVFWIVPCTSPQGRPILELCFAWAYLDSLPALLFGVLVLWVLLYSQHKTCVAAFLGVSYAFYDICRLKKKKTFESTEQIDNYGMTGTKCHWFSDKDWGTRWERKSDKSWLVSWLLFEKLFYLNVFLMYTIIVVLVTWFITSFFFFFFFFLFFF
jgi:hypothetical protein